MTKQTDNPFGNFSGTAVGEAEQSKWEYPGIGYNASQGIFYVNEDQVAGLTLVPLAMRQCKEVEDINGVIHRYPVNHPKAKMVAGDDITYRLQVACIVSDEIFVFGARSWTARASWLNPRSGQWRDEKFATGIWYALDDFIREMKSKHGVATTPLCWQLALKVGEQITVGTGKNTSKSHPIAVVGVPEFIGPERVKQYEALYQDEDLAGWQMEWKKISTEAAAAEEPVEVADIDLPEGMPF